MKKYLEYAGLIVITLFLATIILPHFAHNTLGSATSYSSMNVSPSSATGDTYAYAVSSTAIVDMTGAFVGSVSSSNIVANTLTALTSLTVTNGGTPITAMQCNASTSFNPGNLAVTASTTFDIALVNATTAQRQVYTYGLGGFATTTVMDYRIDLVASSTTGFLHGTLWNFGLTALDIPTSSLSVCSQQF